MPRLRVAPIAALLVLAAPSLALAGAAPVRVLPAPLPTLAVTGAARVSDARVDVTCRGPDGWPECTVSVSFTLTADGDVRLAAATTDARARGLDELRVDGTPLGSDGRALATGEAVHVTVASTRTLALRTEWRDAPWAVVPMLVRHPFLGESEAIITSAGSFGGEPITGSAVTIEGAIHVDVHGARDTSVQVGGTQVETTADVTTTRMTIDVARIAPPPTTSLVRRGGPILAAGARFDLARADDSGRFLLRAGFEAGLTEWVFGSASIETDFDSLMESLLVEVASPEIFLFIPSFGAGIGIVARELGPRDADLGLRVHGQMNLSALALTVDGDYFPAIGTWTGSLALGLGI